MNVIPLTLIISLCLVFTFLVFFWRETSRRRFSSAERDSLLPLAEEVPRVAGYDSSHDTGLHCGGDSGKHPPCPR